MSADENNTSASSNNSSTGTKRSFDKIDSVGREAVAPKRASRSSTAKGVVQSSEDSKPKANTAPISPATSATSTATPIKDSKETIVVASDKPAATINAESPVVEAVKPEDAALVDEKASKDAGETDVEQLTTVPSDENDVVDEVKVSGDLTSSEIVEEKEADDATEPKTASEEDVIEANLIALLEEAPKNESPNMAIDINSIEPIDAVPTKLPADKTTNETNTAAVKTADIIATAIDADESKCAEAEAPTVAPSSPLAPAAAVEIGEVHLTRRSDGALYPAQIIQSRQNDSNTAEFYVHYVGLNRRLDQWVSRDRILSPATADAAAIISAATEQSGSQTPELIKRKLKCLVNGVFYVI